jgi:polysaccharide export outer membrane protein
VFPIGKPFPYSRLLLIALALAAANGCSSVPTRDERNILVDSPVPRELAKVTLADYVIEPPDVLLVEAVKIVPKPPYRIERLDTLAIKVSGTFPDAPIADLYVVDPDGMVRLGPQYGSVRVVGLSIDETRDAIEKHLKETLAEPQVSIELAAAQGQQQVTGEHLVRPDGSIGLGRYGSVRVAGRTLAEAKSLIEAQLANYLEAPEVFVDVVEYNTKVCYVIADGAGFGEQIARFPITGSETVLDVVGQINGLPPVAAKGRIFLVRPTPPENCDCCGKFMDSQVFPVDWVGITMRGSTLTNYQVLPGDRIYIASDHMIAFDGWVQKFTAPFERMFGFTLLGNSTVRAVQFGHRGLGFGNFGTGTGFGAVGGGAVAP